MNSLTAKKNGEIEWLLGDLSGIADGIYSSEFSTVGLNASSKRVNVQWQLQFQLHPNVDDESCVTIGLKNLTDAETSVTFDVSLYSWKDFIDQRRKQEKLGKNESCVLDLSTSEALFEHGISNVAEFEYLNVVCFIIDVKICAIDKVEREDDRESELAAQYESILEAGKFGDVVFKVGGKSMHLHKAILTCASEVFRAMFEHEMKEKKESIVDVVDVDFDVMKEMMRYIYARRVNGIEKIAAELFVVADRYAVEGLKRLSENKLVDQLNVNNVLSRFELSMKYGMVNLKAKVLDFVVRNMKDLVGKQEFKELSSDCKDELFKYISTKTISDPIP